VTSDLKLKVVICWHMHQPQYANRLNGIYQLPWTYLHAIKDYTDMAAHLEAEPAARAVVNFAPILLEQIDDYARQVQEFLQSGREIGDPLLAALGSAVLPANTDDRLSLIKSCLRANEERLIKRFQPYQRLANLARYFTRHPSSTMYFNDQFLADILVWYHLAWLGETLRREDARVKALINKGNNFSYRDRRQLMEIIGEQLSSVIGRYRRLAESGQIELSMTPYAHPIVPLLLDIHCAREAMPGVTLPQLEQYPGGEQRVQWHIEQGKQTFQHYFGMVPQGCWPSEGGVSTAALRCFEAAGFRWVASGENVLRNSLRLANNGGDDKPIHRAYALQDSELACFFRDDGLSDLVGFTYSTWHADDAVANLVHHLENIAGAIQHNGEHFRDNGNVVSIILDGENAWESYPENGYYFLKALYHELSRHPKLEMTTFADCLEQGIPHERLTSIMAGSWVYGTFSTWIGDQDKNRGWDMLGDAKHCFDRKIKSNELSQEQIEAAERQLALCEGSDWFWWFGDYNPSDTVSDFDRLYRMQLVNLYQILGEVPPEYLSHAFARGTGAPVQGGVMRRGSETG
jgi:alpha-amylase/alpha-mannosidase (GH57 family)